jgi:ATP-binding cassette, subfamily B, bacterial MsbA
MKKFLRVIKYLFPYWPKVVSSLSFNLLSVLFGLFSITMLIPFLKILFDTKPIIAQAKPIFELTTKSLELNFNYYVNHISVDHGKAGALAFVCILVIVMSFLKNSCQYLGLYFLAPVRTGVVRDVRQALYYKVLSLPMSFFSEERKGDIISRMTSDVNEIEISIIRTLDLFFREPILIIVYVTALIIMSPKLTLFVLVLLPISGFVIGRIGRTLRKSSLKGQKKLGSLVTVIEETLGGLRVIKAFNAEDRMKERFTNINDFYSRLMVKIWRRRDLATPISEFLGITIMIILLWVGGNLVLGQKGSLAANVFIGYLAVFSQIINPAKQFTTAYYNVIKGLASVDRIESILKAEDVIIDKLNPISIKSFNSSIEFRNVSFKYDKDYVLKNINLKIEKGKTVALVGQSGAGKTTMVDLLPRFYDVTEGEILIDGIPITELKLSDLRLLMGNVNQDPILFNDTFFNNIAFGVDQATEEEVVSAAKVANAHEFIVRTKNKYLHGIGDRGGKLSGGQRQRISIARAVLRNPPILILDEATSALDSESERLVQDALTKLMANRTSLVIAHRLSTVQHADEICVLHQGEIVERGKHAELIEKNGQYKRLHDLQMFMQD